MMYKTNKPIRKRGATIAELMIVVSIFLICVSLILTNFSKQNSIESLNTVTWEITSNFKLARKQAIAQNTRCYVSMHDHGMQVRADSDNDGIIKVNEVNDIKFASPSVRVERTSNKGPMAFTGSGRFVQASSENDYNVPLNYERFRLTHPDTTQVKYVTVYSNGALKVE